MKHFLKEYFYYTRTERNGAIVLALLCVLVFLLPMVYPFFAPEPPGADFSAYQEAVASLMEKEKPLQAAPQRALFAFDPNTLSKDSLQMLGLSARVAENIINYREKVGPFYHPEQLRKVYTLSKADFERLAPYIKIKATAPEGGIAAAPARPAQPGEPPEPFPFNPNHASEEELLRLGLPGKVVRNIIKYRKKGGRFYRPEDLKKIYGMKEEDFQGLAAYIQLPKAEVAMANGQPPAPRPGTPATYDHKPAPTAIDINTATAEEWQTLYGIGPAYAQRIIKFREALGGFAHIDQVSEAYGLPDSTFQRIRPQLRFSALNRKIMINKWSASQLKAHPYLNWKQANALASYRANHGPFQHLEDIRKVRALPKETVDKLAPYLDYHQ